VIALAAKLVARALRAVASLLDPAGVESLKVHIDAGSPEQCEQLAELVAAVARDARGGIR
jgi:hypothetical protein